MRHGCQDSLRDPRSQKPDRDVEPLYAFAYRTQKSNDEQAGETALSREEKVHRLSYSMKKHLERTTNPIRFQQVVTASNLSLRVSCFSRSVLI